MVGNAGFEEILATTYTGIKIISMRSAHIRKLFSFTGWIFGLTSESKDNDKRIGSDTVTVSDGTREKIARLRYVNTLLTVLTNFIEASSCKLIFVQEPISNAFKSW